MHFHDSVEVIYHFLSLLFDFKKCFSDSVTTYSSVALMCGFSWIIIDLHWFSSVVAFSQGASGSHGWGDLSDNYNPPSSDVGSSDVEEVSQPSEASSSELIQEPVVEVPEQEPRTPIGVTGATGLFTGLGKGAKWGVILLTLAGLLVGGIYSFRKVKKPKDKIDWGSNFE